MDLKCQKNVSSEEGERFFRRNKTNEITYKLEKKLKMLQNAWDKTLYIVGFFKL